MEVRAFSHRPSRAGPATPAGPSLTGRALLALAFLVGFYALALAAVGLLVGANVLLFATAGRVQAQLVLATGFVAFAVLRGVFFVARSDSAELTGVPVDERSQPELVAFVRDVAGDMRTAPPDRILLVPEVNAAVTQTGGLLGLRPGERVMVIGVPLMEVLTVDELRGVIAHELGHYAGGDTRLGALTYRAGASIHRTVDHLGHHSLLGRLFSAYGRRYLTISQRVRRHQELTADAAAVRIAGRENHVAALRRSAVTAVAFDAFLRCYLAPLWRRGCDAGNAFEGYRALLADPGRVEDLGALEAAVHDETTDPYDSHPSLAERLAYAERCPDAPWTESDRRPARLLLDDPDKVERQVGALLTRQATGRQMERVVDWGPSAAEVYAADLVTDGAALLRAAGTVVGSPKGATLAWALALVEDGRTAELAAALGARPESGTDVVRYHLGAAIGSYLAAVRGRTWAVSWSGPVGLVDRRGKLSDPFAMAGSLLEDPSSVSRLVRSLGGIARLSAFGAEPASDGAPTAGASTGAGPAPGHPSVVSLVPDVDAYRHHYDLVLTTSSLVLRPIAGGIGYGVRRLMSTQGITAPQANAARRRLESLCTLPEEELLGSSPGALVLSLDDLRQLRRRRGGVLELDISVGGVPRSFRLRCPSKQDRELLAGAIQELVVGRPAAA